MRQRDERVVIGSTLANTRRPMIDDYHDQGQNRLECISPTFGPGTRPKATPKAKPSPTFPPHPLSWMA